MNETTRKFTFGNLEIRKLLISDYIFLAAFAISIAINYYCILYRPDYTFLVSLCIAYAVAFLTISTPFGLRFRNVGFSLVWLVLSILFIFKNFAIAFIPVLTFALYHILRLIFWRQHGREFIPFWVGNYGVMHRHKSKFEGRTGSHKDKSFTKILLWLGIFIILAMHSQMIGIKVR